MPIRKAELLTNQGLLPRPIWVFDNAMNTVGALRAYGITEQGTLGIAVDAYILKREKIEEYNKWQQRVAELARKSAGVKEVLEFFRVPEPPEIFDTRRMYFSIEDPAMDVVMGIGGMQFNALWNPERGNLELFMRTTPGAVAELNARLGAMLATVRLLSDRIKDVEKIETENRYLKARVAELENSMQSLQDFLEQRTKELGDLRTKIRALEIEARSRYSVEDMADFITKYKAGVAQFTDGTKEFIGLLSETRDAFLREEKRLVEALNEVRKEILKTHDIPLSLEQLMYAVTQLLAERPEVLFEQLKKMKEIASLVPETTGGE